MEVRILSTDGVPEHSQMRISSLGTKRCAPLEVDSAFHFQKPMVEATREFEVALLEPVATGDLPAQCRGVARLPLKALSSRGKAARVTVEISETKPKSSDSCSPSKLNTLGGPLDGLHSRKYLRESNMVPFVQSMLHQVMKEKPSNPLEYMRSQVLQQAQRSPQARQEKLSKSEDRGMIEVRILKTEQVPIDGVLGLQFGFLYRQVDAEVGHVISFPCPEKENEPMILTVRLFKWLYSQPILVDEDSIPFYSIPFYSIPFFSWDSFAEPVAGAKQATDKMTFNETASTVASETAMKVEQAHPARKLSVLKAALSVCFMNHAKDGTLLQAIARKDETPLMSVQLQITSDPRTVVKADAALASRSPLRSGKGPAVRIDTALAESSYLNIHKEVMRCGQDLLQQLVVEAPADPYAFTLAFLDHLISSRGAPFKSWSLFPKTPQAPLAPAPKSRGPRDVRKALQPGEAAQEPPESDVSLTSNNVMDAISIPLHLRPSVATWKMQPPAKLPPPHPTREAIHEVQLRLVNGARSGTLSLALNTKQLRNKFGIGLVALARVGRLPVALKLKSIKQKVRIGMGTAIQANRFHAALRTPAAQRKVRNAFVKNARDGVLQSRLRQAGDIRVIQSLLQVRDATAEPLDVLRARHKSQDVLLSGLASGVLKIRLRCLDKEKLKKTAQEGLLNGLDSGDLRSLLKSARDPEIEETRDEWVERPSVATWFCEMPLKIDGPWQPDTMFNLEDKPSTVASVMRLPFMSAGEWAPGDGKAAFDTGSPKARAILVDAAKSGLLRSALSEPELIDKYGHDHAVHRGLHLQRNLRDELVNCARNTNGISIAFATYKKQCEDNLRKQIQVPLVKAVWLFGLSTAFETARQERKDKLRIGLRTELVKSARSGGVNEAFVVSQAQTTTELIRDNRPPTPSCVACGDVGCSLCQKCLFCGGAGCGMCRKRQEAPTLPNNNPAMQADSPEKSSPNADEDGIPDPRGMTNGEQKQAVNECLEKFLATPITFVRNKAEMTPQGIQVIAKVAKLLKKFPDFTILCEAHTYGSIAENDEHRMTLSAERSKVCKTSLQDLGVTNEIATAGCGSKYGLGTACVKMKTVSKIAFKIVVKGAVGLYKTSYFGKMNPQVVVKLSDDKSATSPVHQAGHQTPTWNFDTLLTWEGEPLHIIVTNVNEGKFTDIGFAVIDLSSTRDKSSFSGDLDIFRNGSKKAGSINVAITWPY